MYVQCTCNIDAFMYIYTKNYVFSLTICITCRYLAGTGLCCLLLPGSPGRDDEGGEVDQHRHPAAHRLQDHRRPGLVERDDLGLLGLEPLGQLHRHVHVGQTEGEVEQGVAVRRLNPLVPDHVLATVLLTGGGTGGERLPSKQYNLYRFPSKQYHLYRFHYKLYHLYRFPSKQ